MLRAGIQVAEQRLPIRLERVDRKLRRRCTFERSGLNQLPGYSTTLKMFKEALRSDWMRRAANHRDGVWQEKRFAGKRERPQLSTFANLRVVV